MTGATNYLSATSDFRPPLATLEVKPTWVNRAGRVDRTACVEIRASELWPHAAFREVKRHPTPGSASYLEAIGTITLGARFLHKLHVDRNPLKLQGDWRTEKTNVMKSRKRSSSKATLRDPHPSPLPEGEPETPTT